MSTLTVDQENKIAAWLDEHPTLTSGLGNKEQACSVAAINLALTGKLTDEIPNCMSEVVGRWIIRVQDAMPTEIRNSAEWRALLPKAAGTGRELEQERLDVIMEWLWSVVLPSVQPVADVGGFGGVWAEMCVKRTAYAARSSAYAATAATAANAADAARSSAYAATAFNVAASATYAGADAAAAAEAAAAAWAAADAAAYAAATSAAYAGSASAVWVTFDPVGVLRQLIEVGS